MTTTRTDRLAGLVGTPGFKAPVAVCAATNITLEGEQTIDGVAVTAGDRVLVNGQTSSVDNGIYVVATGSWTRAKDCDGSYDLVEGALVLVNAGTSYSGFWYLSTTGTITPGTTALTWTQASSVLAVFSALGQTMVSLANAAAGRLALEVPDSDGWSVGPTATYVSSSSFTVTGDQTATLTVGRRVRITDSGGTKYGTILTSAYTSLTTITLDSNSDTLASPISQLEYGVIDFAGATSALSILDEDNMASDSAGSLATQQSIKAYIDGLIAVETGRRPVYNAAVTLNSGTFTTYTSLPTDINWFAISFTNLQTSGTTDPIKIGVRTTGATTGVSGHNYSRMQLGDTTQVHDNYANDSGVWLPQITNDRWSGTLLFRRVLPETPGSRWSIDGHARDDFNLNNVVLFNGYVSVPTVEPDGFYIGLAGSDTFSGSGTYMISYGY